MDLPRGIDGSVSDVAATGGAAVSFPSSSLVISIPDGGESVEGPFSEPWLVAAEVCSHAVRSFEWVESLSASQSSTVIVVKHESSLSNPSSMSEA